MEKECSIEAPTQTPNPLCLLPRVPSCCSYLSPTLHFSSHNYPINAGLMPLWTRIEVCAGLGLVDQHSFPYLAHQRAFEGSQHWESERSFVSHPIRVVDLQMFCKCIVAIFLLNAITMSWRSWSPNVTTVTRGWAKLCILTELSLIFLSQTYTFNASSSLK